MRIFGAMQRQRGPLLVLMLRLGAVLLVYSALRFLFWRLNRGLLGPVRPAAFLGGVRFDISAIAWLHLPWVLLVLAAPWPGRAMRAIQTSLFMAANAIPLFFACVDLGYYAFSLKRSTADFLGILTAGGDTLALAPSFLQGYWHLLAIYLMSLAFLWWAYGRAMPPTRPAATGWKKEALWRALVIAGMAIGTRGGLQLIPLQPLDAARYGGAEAMPVVLNTPFTLLTTLGKPVLAAHHYMDDAEADTLWPVVHPASDSAIAVASPRPNVVFIILESFSAAYSARLSGGQGYMPFLDSLMDRSLCFTSAYANGRRSIDGIPAVLAAMPQWSDEAFITSNYAQAPFTSLAGLLAGTGYRTSFYHGGRNGTMGFDGFARSAGFQRYVGLDEYPDEGDFDGHWGVRDAPFLRFFADELNREAEPFCAALFTLSSHHPYELPPDDAARFGGGTMPIHPTLRYADDALRGFFAKARRMPWFDRTIFAITADHTADIDRSGNTGHKPVDYWVPMLIHAPGLIAPRDDDRPMQHIDLMPTVLDLAGYPEPYFCFGHSALRPHRPGIAIWQNNGLYSCTSSRQQLAFDGERVLSVASLDGRPEGDSTSAGRMERLLKAALQQYTAHVMNGELRWKGHP
jgi:hypothetical protein